MTRTIRPKATFCDVCLTPDGHFVFVYVGQDGATHCEVDGKERWKCATPKPLIWIRIAASPTEVCVVGAAADDKVHVILNGTYRKTRGPSFGQNPVAVRWSAEKKFELSMVVDKTRYAVGPLDGPFRTFTQALSSQGIRDWHPERGILLANENANFSEWWIAQRHGA